MIYTSSMVYFHIKNLISNSFNRFNTVLDRASFTSKFRGFLISFLRLSQQCLWTAGWFLNSIRVFLQSGLAKRYRPFVAAGSFLDDLD